VESPLSGLDARDVIGCWYIKDWPPWCSPSVRCTRAGGRSTAGSIQHDWGKRRLHGTLRASPLRPMMQIMTSSRSKTRADAAFPRPLALRGIRDRKDTQ